MTSNDATECGNPQKCLSDNKVKNHSFQILLVSLNSPTVLKLYTSFYLEVFFHNIGTKLDMLADATDLLYSLL